MVRAGGADRRQFRHMGTAGEVQNVVAIVVAEDNGAFSRARAANGGQDMGEERAPRRHWQGWLNERAEWLRDAPRRQRVRRLRDDPHRACFARLARLTPRDEAMLR